MKTAIILYELEQLTSLDALLEKWSVKGAIPVVVSLDAEIDYALEKRGVPFVSGKTLQNRIAPDSYMRSDELTREIFEHKLLSFLQYREVSLLRPLRLSFHQYLQTLLYYIEIMAKFVDHAGDIQRLIVPAPTTPVSATSGILAEHEVFVVVEAVRRVAESRDIIFESVRSISVSLRAGNKLQEFSFAIKKMLFSIGLSLLNAVMSLRPRRAIRVIASDYWRNIAPILHEIPDAELVLFDRSEIFKISISNIWRHKMRFMHSNDFLSRHARQETIQYSEECLKKWLTVRSSVMEGVDYMFCGVSLVPVCEQIMKRLVEHAVPRVVGEIAATYRMYERLSPNTVLLRASVSGQIHFAVLPLVARQMNISALEVQHGGDYFGPGSPTRDRAAYFFATYGPLVCDELRNLDYAEDRLLAVGSPRFDAYARDAQKVSVRQKISEVTILTNTPSINIGERFGTYSIEEYFSALSKAVQNIPNSRLLVASRSASVRSVFGEEARVRGLNGVNYKNVGTTPLPKLFEQTDIFVCSHSTVVYEALLYRLPVVIASFAPVEKMMTDFHFSHFRDAGALLIAHTPKELADILQKLASDPDARARMSAAGLEFMQKNFSFDGLASKRVAAFIRSHS